jgi:hypothetical protein
MEHIDKTRLRASQCEIFSSFRGELRPEGFFGIYSRNPARAAFAARQDVKDAQAVRAAIELLEPGDGLIDRLSPDEWAAFAKDLRIWHDDEF